MAGKASPIILGDDKAPERLGELLRARRIEDLGYKKLPVFWQDCVLAQGLGEDLSERTVRALETGTQHGRHRLETLHVAARVYKVTYDSIMAVLEHGANALVPATPALPPRGGWAGPQPPSWMADDTRDALSPYAVPVFVRLIDVGRPGGPDGDLEADGADMFGSGTVEAANWDQWAAQGFPPVYRVWLTAYVRLNCDPKRNGVAS